MRNIMRVAIKDVHGDSIDQNFKDIDEVSNLVQGAVVSNPEKTKTQDVPFIIEGISVMLLGAVGIWYLKKKQLAKNEMEGGHFCKISEIKSVLINE